MSDCAVELRSSIEIATGCPGEDATVMFIGPSWYKRYSWPSLLDCIVGAVQEQIAPDDEDIVVGAEWQDRNYYDWPDLAGVRFRLFRDGNLMNSTQWRKLDTGGWQLLISGDVLGESVYTIVRY